jgi:hypothetical protein
MRLTLRGDAAEERRQGGARAPPARGAPGASASRPQARTGSTRTRHRTRPRSADTCHHTARAVPRRARSPPARSGGRRDDRSSLLPGPSRSVRMLRPCHPSGAAKGAETRPATGGCVGGCAQVLHRARRAAYAPPPTNELEPASGQVGPHGPGRPFHAGERPARLRLMGWCCAPRPSR